MELLHRVRLRQVHIQDGKGRVVNLRPTADVEHPFFVVGRFQGLAHPDRRRGDGGDLHHVQTPRLMALRVRAQRVQGALGGWGDLHLTLLDAPDTAGGEQVLALEDGIEHQKHAAACIQCDLEEVTVDHLAPVGPVLVCEGVHTALALAVETHRE